MRKCIMLTEEDILLLLLPQLQRRLDIEKLKPHLKLLCSITDEECHMLLKSGSSKNSDIYGADMLVELLRKKNPHCCARVLLSALKQSMNVPSNNASNHLAIIELLQSELRDMSKVMDRVSSHFEADGAFDMDSLLTSSTQEANYFVPESPSNQSSEPNDDSSHLTKKQRSDQLCWAKNSGTDNDNMVVVISLGPSREHRVLMRDELYNSMSEHTESGVKYDLLMQSRLIQTQFSDLILKVCTILQNSPTACIEKLQMWLSFQSCSRAIQSIKAFDSGSDALKARTIPALISSLHSYSSWYNYHLIADIARHFCGDEGSVLVEAYETKVKDFFQRLLIHCPPLFPGHEATSKNSEILEMKIMCDLSTAYLKDIAIFKHTLCHLCELDPRFLVVRKIDATNSQMSWGIPKAATESTIKAMILKSNDFSQKNIQEIRMSDSQIIFKSTTSTTPSTTESNTAVPVKRSIGAKLHVIPGTAADRSTNEYKTCSKVSINNDKSRSGSLDDYYNPQNEHSLPVEVKDFPHGNHRDKKAQFVDTVVSGDEISMTSMSFLSEINKSLKDLNLLSHDSIAPSKTVAKITKRVTRSSSEIKLDPITEQNKIPRKSVSILWRILGRAKPECSANIYVTSIQNISKIESDDIEVKKGQQLRALYRISGRIFVKNLSLDQGFLPYSSCRLSRKYYGSHSKLIQLSYLQLFAQSPDGVDILPAECVPTINVVTVRDHIPSFQDEIHAQSGESFSALYCDASWIYASNGKSSGFLPRSVCVLSKESQITFQNWQQNGQPFQSDFIIKHNCPCPLILDKNPVSLANTEQRTASRIGKMFTVIQNFAPDSPVNGNFTIRKGLRVKVIEENGQSLCVRTKTGVSFWIPSSHLRPARK